MTRKQMKKVRELLLALIQRDCNGHPYVTIKTESIDYCGGYQLVITDIPLFHENEVLAIIGICLNCCVQFKLLLNEKCIVLL